MMIMNRNGKILDEWENLIDKNDSKSYDGFTSMEVLWLSMFLVKTQTFWLFDSWQKQIKQKYSNWRACWMGHLVITFILSQSFS